MSDWRHDAACLNEDPELFFPVGDDGPARTQATEAKDVCRRCDVRRRCLSWAIATGQKGIWGGMSEEGRRKRKQSIDERRRLKTAA